MENRLPTRNQLRVAVSRLTPMLAAALVLSAQSRPDPGIRRLSDGRPDLQGTYDTATVTPLERPPGQPFELTDDQARTVEQRVLDLVALANRPSSPTRSAPPMGGDGSTGNSGNVGGYNVYWIGGLPWRVTVLDGRARTSLIIDPPDGRLPPRTDGTVPSPPPASEPPDAADDPERRTLAERCLLVGFTSGAPILPFLYNNVHQIVQTSDDVLIFSEMVHDARIVRIGGRHLPQTIRTWLGDSTGRWDGDTLVVDTTNFTDANNFLGARGGLHVVERLTPIGGGALRYRFTVEDPQTWPRPWTGEYVWVGTDERIFEYACHEGNYALPAILRGARFAEQKR
jgi:hypothetical protein